MCVCVCVWCGCDCVVSVCVVCVCVHLICSGNRKMMSKMGMIPNTLIPISSETFKISRIGLF